MPTLIRKRKLILRRSLKKNLIFCPNDHIVAEVLPDGSVLIQRMHQHHTKISGKEFSISCHECGEGVFIKNEKISTQTN